jgi:hypothetical protein
MARTIAARRGALPLFSTPATQEVAAAAPSPFGSVGAVDRHPGIRRDTWSPAALGLSFPSN